MTSKVLIAADHAGFPLKSLILKEASKLFPEVEFVDLGTYDSASVDYPDYAKRVCERILKGEVSRGILTCGSGQGMAIQANRFKGIRAALCWNTESARLSRAHNNSNVLCIPGRLIPDSESLAIVKVWLNTPFEGGRHLTRVQKID